MAKSFFRVVLEEGFPHWKMRQINALYGREGASGGERMVSCYIYISFKKISLDKEISNIFSFFQYFKLSDIRTSFVINDRCKII